VPQNPIALQGKSSENEIKKGAAHFNLVVGDLLGYDLCHQNAIWLVSRIFTDLLADSPVYSSMHRIYITEHKSSEEI
jgi:hypothetical protein